MEDAPKKIKVAVVEDDEKLRELWTDVLEASFERCPNCGSPIGNAALAGAEYEVEAFEDGESFLSANPSRFDVALVDLMLKPDGLHGVSVIRRASRDVVCVGISGSSDTDRASAHLAGAKVVVEKPAAIRGVREVVRAAIALYGTKWA